jgi:hypothetical protein
MTAKEKNTAKNMKRQRVTLYSYMIEETIDLTLAGRIMRQPEFTSNAAIEYLGVHSNA